MERVADIEDVAAYILVGENTDEAIILPKDIVELHKGNNNDEIPNYPTSAGAEEMIMAPSLNPEKVSYDSKNVDKWALYREIMLLHVCWTALSPNTSKASQILP